MALEFVYFDASTPIIKSADFIPDLANAPRFSIGLVGLIPDELI